MNIFLTIIALFNLTVNSTQNKVEKSEFLESKFDDARKVVESWENSNFNYSFKFKNNEKYYNVFKVEEKNESKGHFVLNEKGELESFYVGDSSKLDYSDKSALSPIFSNDCDDIGEEETSTINNNLTLVPPVLNTDLYRTSSSSFHSEQLIINCPYYYNEPNGPVKNGCSPTAAAMMISFYNKYSDLDNLLDQQLPLNHEENRNGVDNLIKELAKLMRTDPEKGTPHNQITAGYNKYLYSRGYASYEARASYSFDDYSYLINTFNCPAHLSIYTASGYENKDQMHSVLGVDTANIRDSGRFMITHYGVENDYKGNYYVAEKYFIRFCYIGSAL